MPIWSVTQIVAGRREKSAEARTAPFLAWSPNPTRGFFFFFFFFFFFHRCCHGPFSRNTKSTALGLHSDCVRLSFWIYIIGTWFRGGASELEGARPAQKSETRTTRCFSGWSRKRCPKHACWWVEGPAWRDKDFCGFCVGTRGNGSRWVGKVMPPVAPSRVRECLNLRREVGGHAGRQLTRDARSSGRETLRARRR